MPCVAGEFLIGPEKGMTGKSCAPVHPGPEMWVMLNPRSRSSSYLYPPPEVRTVSGLHCIIPKGTTAPGKSIPAPPPWPKSGPPSWVPTNGLT